MASNSNTAYLQYWEDFSLLGKSIKKYAIALCISMLATIVGGFIIFIAIFIAFMSMYSDYSSLIIVVVFVLFFIIIELIIGIYQLITYIQYLTQLKKIGEYTNDIDLQKAYKWELWALITSIFIWVILLPGIFVLNIGGSLLSYNVEMLETGYYSFILLFLGYIIVILIVVMLSIIFQLLSALALERWAQRIRATNFRNPNAIKMVEGTGFMKFGRIILIVGPPIMLIMGYMGFFAIFIGNILFLIGFMKAGKGIMEFFDGYGNYISNQGAALPQFSISSHSQQSGASTTNPNLNSTHMVNTSYGNTTIKPQAKEFCSFCGSKLENENSMFCSNCGRKLL